MTVSPFDHPVLRGLLGDDEIAAFFSVTAEIAALLDVEVALARAEARTGIIPEAAAARIAEAASGFAPDIDALRHATARDGVAIPDLIRQLRARIGGDAATQLHWGATSQDIIDSGLMLRLKPALAVLGERLGMLIAALSALAARHGDRSLMAKTRMQDALAITVADRITAWQAPLERHAMRLAALRESLPVQLGGAVGTLGRFGDKGPATRAAFAHELGLADTPQWQSQRDLPADIAHVLSLVTGSLGKFGQDVALMAQAGDEVKLSGGGNSSAMAHKQNPVAAEALVTLARFNATLLSGMHQSLVHEQERSGAAWTLEWLLLPQMMVAAGAASRLAIELAGKIEHLG